MDPVCKDSEATKHQKVGYKANKRTAWMTYCGICSYFSSSLPRRAVIAGLGLIVAVSLPSFILASQDHVNHPVTVDGGLVVDEVWAGTRVGYDALSVGSIVYIAYYDADRLLSVARIDTVSGAISKRKLGSVFGGWDAHNYLTLAYDRFGHLHVAGNMHVSPLVYARMLKPHSFDSLTRVASMVGRDENSVTSPKFFNFPDGNLGLTYRYGKSGDAIELINRFDGSSWSRHSTVPVFSSSNGQPSVSAYHTGYVNGSDGYFHVAWVWRLKGTVADNFDVNYSRSKDLKHWLDSRGKELAAPMTPGNTDVVDSIPTKSGLFNNVKLGFDGYNLPVVSYLKYDELGYTQLYHARPHLNGWQVTKITDWHFRWELEGAGTLVQKISFSGVQTFNGIVNEKVMHPDEGSLVISYSKNAMKVERIETKSPEASTKCQTVAPWMHVSQQIATTSPDAFQGRIMWQSLPKDNKDLPRSCGSIGLTEGCSMISLLILVPVADRKACAP